MVSFASKTERILKIGNFHCLQKTNCVQTKSKFISSKHCMKKKALKTKKNQATKLFYEKLKNAI